MDVEAQKMNALAWLAAQFVGLTDQDGGSYLVQRFQKAVGGKAQGEPWCAAFALWCVQEVDDLFDQIYQAELEPHQLLLVTESTQALWNSTPSSQRSAPSVGSIAVWQEVQHPAFGHCGIVTGVDGDTVETCEGNTSGSPGGNQRAGGCVWAKSRTGGQIPGFALQGYLRPWAVQQ